MTPDTRIVVDGLGFPESPRWRAGEWWCTDHVARRILTVGPDGRVVVRHELDDRSSGIGWMPDGDVAEELLFPNGMVITPDGATLIVGETLGARLSALAIAADGSLGPRRTFADVGDLSADGICLDVGGAVWVASPATGTVVRVAEGGEVLATVTPHATPHACMLGGPERRTLLVTTSEGGGDDPPTALRTGRIETLEVEVAGAGTP